ncbi:MAG TPA: hypothetical protein VD993_16480 [Chitinophagaceae bacterium]|nr:hypothetical protein [Chitinophagaceae bacterium]
MELEQFKNIWGKETGPQQKKDEYFLSLLSKRSNSPINRMKRNLMWEIVAVIVMYGAGVVYYLLAFGGKMAEIAWLLLFLGIFFLGYYYRKNKLLSNMQCISCHVKSNLQLQLGTLEKYVRFYLLVGNILTPVTMLIVGYVAFILFPERLHKDFPPSTVRLTIIIFIVSVIVLTVGGIYLNKWLVNRLYGRHIKKLKEILNEMEE